MLQANDMAATRNFRLMVPPGYGASLIVSGKTGLRPDTQLLDTYGHCARIRLPSVIDDLVFTFKTLGSSPETIQNFYFLPDFFVVSETMKDFILGYFNEGDVEVRRVRVNHGDGSPAIEPYFALKIVKTIDCIDPVLSTAGSAASFSSKDPKPFSETITNYELEQSLVAEFANKDGSHYISYPWHLAIIQDVCLRESEIPDDVVLLQPAFWPGHLIVDAEFGRLLDRRCSGSAMGYYLWMVDLKGVARSHHEILVGMR
jgi:hypothetical protein